MASESEKSLRINQHTEVALSSIVRLVKTEVFASPVLRPFREPVFALLMLRLDNILQVHRDLGKRIAFTDDVKDGDITDLVNTIRNAIAHTTSTKNIINKKTDLYFAFNIFIGKSRPLGMPGTEDAGSDYDDDIAICYGPYRIYWKRHIIRAINELADAHCKSLPDGGRQFMLSLQFAGN